LRVIMACSSVSTVNGVSAADRRYQAGCGVPPGAYSASSSSDGFQEDLETTYAAPRKDLHHSRTVASRARTEITSTSTVYASGRTYASLSGSWYPQSSDYYAVSATGYPARAGSRLQTTCSTVTWPKLSTGDVKPTSFVLSPPPVECNANCRQNYYKEQ